MSHKIIQGGYFNSTLRTWQSRTSIINPDCLIYPIFISQDPDALEEIKSLPGQYRVGRNKLESYLNPYVSNGLKTVLLFGVMDDQFKEKGTSQDVDVKNQDTDGLSVISENNPVHEAVKLLRKVFPSLTIACDVCLCAFTTHGHCEVEITADYRLGGETFQSVNSEMSLLQGVLDNEGGIDNKRSVETIARAAYEYVKSGCHIIAPSDCMDGRIKAISVWLKNIGERNKVAIMSYSSKFASCFYGPFRDAARSAPSSGDRRCYQLPPGASGLANKTMVRDIEEEADILMVKPGMPYLDVVKETKLKHPDYPIAIYQVSGEYAMLYHASQHGAFELKKAVLESLQCMHRAGADVLITYFTPQVLKWLKEEE